LSSNELDKLRDGIDDLDKKIIDLLNERAKLANKIGIIKKKMEIPIYNPNRESEVLKNVISHNKGPLSETAVKRLYERIIDEIRRLERESSEHEQNEK